MSKDSCPRGPHSPLSRRRPPGWPLGDPRPVACGCLSDAGRARLTWGPTVPGAPDVAPARPQPRPGLPLPSWAQALHEGPSAQALCRAGQRPTLLQLLALPWKRGDAAVNKVCHRRAAIPHPTSCPWAGPPDWPGGAQQAGTQLACDAGNGHTAPPTPPLPRRDGELPAPPPTCWVPRPGRHTLLLPPSRPRPHPALAGGEANSPPPPHLQGPHRRPPSRTSRAPEAGTGNRCCPGALRPGSPGGPAPRCPWASSGPLAAPKSWPTRPPRPCCSDPQCGLRAAPAWAPGEHPPASSTGQSLP